MADGSPTPLILPIDLSLYNYTHKVSHIEKCTYTHGRWMANGRSMLHHYTHKVSHREEYTCTHDRWTLFNQQLTHATPFHPISFTYRRMHIYPWQMDPQPPSYCP